jgi:hypothetical protein
VWLRTDGATSATYNGASNTSSGFFSIAADAAGNLEAAKAIADANTVTPVCAADASSQVSIVRSGFRLDRTINKFV